MAAKKFSKQEVLCILEDSDCSDFDSNISCDESGGNELMKLVLIQTIQMHSTVWVPQVQVSGNHHLVTHHQCQHLLDNRSGLLTAQTLRLLTISNCSLMMTL